MPLWASFPFVNPPVRDSVVPDPAGNYPLEAGAAGPARVDVAQRSPATGSCICFHPESRFWQS